MMADDQFWVMESMDGEKMLGGKGVQHVCYNNESRCYVPC